jgi:hypothetical protein
VAVPPLTNTCQGTNGVQVSTANSVGPNQFDSVTLSGAGNTFTYDTTHIQNGTVSIKSAIGATSGTTYCGWKASIGGTPYATMYSRLYLWVDVLPTSNTRIVSFHGTATSAGMRFCVQLLTTGQLRTINAAGSTVATTTATVPTGQWVRVELDGTGSTAAGVITCRLYNTATSTTPTETLNSTAQNTTDTIDEIRFGQSSAVTSNTYWMSSLGVGYTGPMGPSFPVNGNALSAAGKISMPSDLTINVTRQWEFFAFYPRSAALNVFPGSGASAVPVTTGQIWPRGKK